MKKGDYIIYDPVGMLKKIAAEAEKAKQEAEKNELHIQRQHG